MDPDKLYSDSPVQKNIQVDDTRWYEYRWQIYEELGHV
jgi:hypothetical protein